MRRNWTLIALIAAAVAHYAGASSLLTFAITTIALAALAWIVSFSTEQVGERFGPAVTGLLQSTLGNLPEFFIVVFALSAGEVVVAETSIIGSIFANALLCSGWQSSQAAMRARMGSCASARACPRTTQP